MLLFFWRLMEFVNDYFCKGPLLECRMVNKETKWQTKQQKKPSNIQKIIFLNCSCTHVVNTSSFSNLKTARYSTDKKSNLYRKPQKNLFYFQIKPLKGAGQRKDV